MYISGLTQPLQSLMHPIILVNNTFCPYPKFRAIFLYANLQLIPFLSPVHQQLHWEV